MKFYIYTDKSNSQAAQAAYRLEKVYPHHISSLRDADVIVSLGGDGTTIGALREGLRHNKKVYGMNLGHLGAYQNKFYIDNLPERIEAATEVVMHPLTVEADVCGNSIKAHAWNEVYIRSGDNPQQARLMGMVDGWVEPFVIHGDGYLLSTAMGSCAYNLAAGGHKLHFREKLLASTAIAAIRGVQDILPEHSRVHIDVLAPEKRNVKLFTDNIVLGPIDSCDIYQDFSKKTTLLWDAQKVKEFEEQGERIKLARHADIVRAIDTQGFYHNSYCRT